MAITFRACQNNGATAGSSLAVTKPTGTVDGDLLVAIVSQTASAGTATITPPAGWTPIDTSGNGTTLLRATFFKIAAGEGANFPFALGGTTVSAIAIVAAFTGTTAAPLDVHAVASNASATAACAPGVTTTAANALLVYAGAATGNQTWAPPAGFTEPTNGERQDPSAIVTAELAYNLDAGAAGATGDAAGTLSTANVSRCFLAAFALFTGPTPVSAADSAAITATEARTLVATAASPDTGPLAATETAPLLALAVPAATSPLAATEGATVLATATAADAGPLAAAEAATVTATVTTAAETALLVGTETANALPVGGTTPTAADAAVLATVEDAAILALVAAANPVTLLMPLSGSLVGQDRAGAAAGSTTGPARFQVAQAGRINLAQNPSFETDAGFWAASGGGAIARVVGDGTAGTACLEVSGSASSAGANTITGPMVVVPGRTYTVALDAKLVSGAADWFVSVVPLNAANGALVATTNVVQTLTAGWARYAVAYTVPAGAVGTHRLGVWFRRASAAAAVARIDAVVVEEAAVVLPAFDGDSPGASWLDPVAGTATTAHASASVLGAALWLEAPATNALPNPQIGLADPGWTATGATLANDGTYQRRVGTAACKVVTANVGTAEGLQAAVAAAPGQTWTGSVWVRGGGGLRIEIDERDAGGATLGGAATAFAAADAWTRYAVTYAVTDPTSTQVVLLVITGSRQAATFWVTDAQLEPGDHPTSFVHGYGGPGYAWSGVANSSPSTRAAATASLPAADRIDPTRGAVAAWFRRDDDAGREQRVVRVGLAGVAGQDCLRVGVGADDRFAAVWKAGTSADQVVAVPGPVAVGAWLLAYAEWSLGHFAASLNGGAATATEGRVAAGTLTGADFAFGQDGTGTLALDGLVGPLAVFARPLSAAELAALVATGPPWPMGRFGPSGDTGLLAAVEAGVPLAPATGADVGGVNGAEAWVVAVAAATAESPPLAAAEDWQTAVTAAAADAGALAATEAATAGLSLVAADASTLAATEGTSVFAGLSFAETVFLDALATPAVLASVPVAETAQLSGAEAATRFEALLLAAADVGTLGAVETGAFALPTQAAAADAGVLRATETALAAPLAPALWTPVALLGGGVWATTNPGTLGWGVPALAGSTGWQDAVAASGVGWAEDEAAGAVWTEVG